MTIRLFNTLSSTVEDLIPAGTTTFGMYACGPTVYDYGHIGNFRTFLQVDVLRRFLKQQGIAVRHVMNVTDVDDKIIANAAKAGLPIEEYTPRFENAFFEDLDSLNVEHPEIIARATENIEEMVALIERLAAQNLAYRTEDGSWYFRIAGFPEYGKLSKKDFEGIRTVLVSMSMNTTKTPPAISRYGRPPNRASILGNTHRLRPPRLAHRVLGHGDEVPRRNLRPPRRRRRPHVPPPRERDRPIRIRHPQALRAALVPRPLPAC